MQLLKRTETVEKEKNDAVCRYAAKEAQLMRLREQIEGLEVQVHFSVFFFKYFYVYIFLVEKFLET